MSAFLPHSPTNLIWISIVLGLALAAGLALSRGQFRSGKRLTAWLTTVAVTLAVERITASEPPGYRMVVIIAALLLGMKAVVSVEERLSGEAPLLPLQWLAFALGWLGMKPGLFRHLGSSPRSGVKPLLINGIINAAAGMMFLIVGRALFAHEGNYLKLTKPIWVAPFLLVGLSLILHFGWINLTASLWRAMGVDARPLFRMPIFAKSLSEFWSQRWNQGFTEMTAMAVYRPLVKRLGRPGSLLACFLVSGLFHELAISVPVNAGYGLPMTYFVLHGLLVVGEEKWRIYGFAGREIPMGCRLWTAAWLLFPLPLVFHSPFYRGIICPLVGLSSK